MPRHDLPEHVQRRFVDFHWDRDRLWKIEAPVESLAVSEMLWMLELPIWQRAPEQTLFDLAPSEVLAALEHDPLAHPQHAKRIHAADLACPVLLMQNSLSEWVILDGYHRLAKAKLTRVERLPAKKLPRSAIPLIRTDRPSF